VISTLFRLHLNSSSPQHPSLNLAHPPLISQFQSTTPSPSSRSPLHRSGVNKSAFRILQPVGKQHVTFLELHLSLYERSELGAQFAQLTLEWRLRSRGGVKAGRRIDRRSWRNCRNWSFKRVPQSKELWLLFNAGCYWLDSERKANLGNLVSHQLC